MLGPGLHSAVQKILDLGSVGPVAKPESATRLMRHVVGTKNCGINISQWLFLMKVSTTGDMGNVQ